VSVKGLRSGSTGLKIILRKSLYDKRKRIADYSLIVAMFGVVVMVVETEMSMAHVYEKVSRRAPDPRVSRSV